MNEHEQIHLQEDAFIGLLQGKKIEWVNGFSGKRWTIYPPHYGLYFTHAQIAELQRSARMSGVREFIELLDKMQSNTDNPKP
jgi:hypothetical protein